MSVKGLYEQIQTWNPDSLREYIATHHPEDYQLLDVRQRAVYGHDHLPGAISVPAADLPLRLESLDAQKPTVVYCDQGALARAAAEVLVKAGWKEVQVLAGGLHAWKHGLAVGLPQRACADFLAAENAEQQALLAWQTEEAARRFYQQMAETIEEPEVAALFTELAEAESHHKATLKELWEALAGRLADNDFPGKVEPVRKTMEGGQDLTEALSWAADATTAQILDFAMAMELSAFDQYLYLQRRADNPDSQRLYEMMADEERHHLKLFGQMLERFERAV